MGRTIISSLNTSVQNNSFTVVLSDNDSKKKESSKYWIKERLKFRVENPTFELGMDGNVSLSFDIFNCSEKSWHDDIKVKMSPGSLFFGIEQPISKRLRSKNSTRVTVNLRMAPAIIKPFCGRTLLMELAGCDEKKNIKYCSDSFKVMIQGELFAC
jgi:hypothetical protein